MGKAVKNTVIKNFSSLLVAQIIYKILAFIMIIMIARFLGAEQLGQFAYASSFVWIFLFLSDLGLADLFVRDVSRRRELLTKYISSIFTLKILLGGIAYIVIILLASRFSFGREKFWAILILGASVILDSFMYFFRAFFRVKETMEYEALFMAIEAFLKVGIVFLAIYSGFSFSGVILLSLAILVVSITNFTINFMAVFFKCKAVSLSIDRVLWARMLKLSFPFAAVYILSFLNFRVDTVMLSLMKGDESAGFYSVNYKLLEQLIMVPVTLSAVCLPVFARLSDSFRNTRRVVRNMNIALFLFSLLSVILVYFFGQNIIILIYGNKFRYAGQYMFMLSLALIPFFLKPLMEKLLFVLHKQKELCLLYLSLVAVNILLNCVLIPRWGINGAALATFIAETAMASGCFIIYRRLCFVKTSISLLDKVGIEEEVFY